MPEQAKKKTLWSAAEIAPTLRPFTQRLNPNSLFRAAALSRLAGMSRAHVSLVRLPPGKDSFAYHAHMLEEEWIYILSGRAIAEIETKLQCVAGVRIAAARGQRGIRARRYWVGRDFECTDCGRKIADHTGTR